MHKCVIDGIVDLWTSCELFLAPFEFNSSKTCMWLQQDGQQDAVKKRGRPKVTCHLTQLQHLRFHAKSLLSLLWCSQKSKASRSSNPSGKSKKQKEVTVAHLDVPTVIARCEFKKV